MDIKSNLKQLRSEGITFIENGYTQKECQLIKRKLDLIIDKFSKKKIIGANKESQVIINPFRHDKDLTQLILHKKVDQILNEVLDPDYVMIQCSVNNRKIRNDLPSLKTVNPGTTWHTDSRYLGNKKISSGFGYLVIGMFDEFSKNNSGTKYVPKSHLRTGVPERNKNYKYETITGKPGTIAIMDSGIWHKAGDPTEASRWSMFSLYGGWFMKPYYRYWDMFTKIEKMNLSNKQKKILHFNSLPPKNEQERTSTLVRYPK